VKGSEEIQAISRDDSDLERAIREHGPAMLAVARRLLSNEDDARECVQDAYLRAFAKADLFEGRSTFRTWLHRIVVNAALGILRSRKQRKTQTIDGLLPEFDANGCRIEPMWQFTESLEQMLEREETRVAVHQAIDALPDIYRIVLVLRDIEEYSTEEVSNLLETNIAVVKTRLHRARAALKKQLEPQWVSGDL
jgi:RNA polymerase sigma-70 factor (ECF subfamily)